MILAGGIAILPSCSKDKAKASIHLTNLNVSAHQEALLAEIVESIIPETKTAGAKTLNLHLFVLKMVDDCHEAPDQQNFMLGLNEIDDLTKRSLNTTFVKAAGDQRTKILEGIEHESDKSSALSQFYKIMKERTIQGYLNSKHVMTELIPYELIPGRYNGYFLVKNV